MLHKLSPLDSGFLLTESHHSPKHVGCIQILKLPRGQGTSWLKKMLDDLKQIQPGFPFGHKLKDSSLIQPALVEDEKFDADYHVRHTVLPGPGSEKQLVEMVARLHTNLLDRDRPLWEFHLIEGLSDRRFAFYTKIHHAIVDGMTFAHWFAESGSLTAADLESRPIWQRDEAPAGNGHSGGLPQLLASGIKMLGGGVKTTLDLSSLGARLVQRNLLQGNRNAVLPLGAARTRFNVPTGAARSLSISSYPLEDIRKIGHALGGSINDIVMTLCDIAVNRYLDSHGDKPEKPLVAYMPVNLRKQEDDEGNLISLLQVKLATDHDDPVLALEQIKDASRSTREIYSSVSRPAVQTYSLAVALLPLGEEILHLERILPPAVNLVISNVPGAQERMYFRSAEITEVYPVNTLPPAVALSITVCSYAGTLFFGLISGRTVVPDLESLKGYLEEAYGEFREISGLSAG